MQQATRRVQQATRRMQQATRRMQQTTRRMQQATRRMQQATRRMQQTTRRMQQITRRMQIARATDHSYGSAELLGAIPLSRLAKATASVLLRHVWLRTAQRGGAVFESIASHRCG
jgi:hypothetical protein